MPTPIESLRSFQSEHFRGLCPAFRGPKCLSDLPEVRNAGFREAHNLFENRDDSKCTGEVSHPARRRPLAALALGSRV